MQNKRESTQNKIKVTEIVTAKSPLHELNHEGYRKQKKSIEIKLMKLCKT